MLDLYKKSSGRQDEVKNYRPITKISHIPKVSESLINDQQSLKLTTNGMGLLNRNELRFLPIFTK